MRLGKTTCDGPSYRLREEMDPMKQTEHEKDIGVVIDTKLSFEEHIAQKVKKANGIMGVISREGLWNLWIQQHSSY